MRQLSPEEEILAAQLAGLALVDRRTIRRYLQGQRVQPLIAARLAMVIDGAGDPLRALGAAVARHKRPTALNTEASSVAETDASRT